MSENLTVTYDSNNSGGSWWLDDDQWKALEAAGWEVRWVKTDDYQSKQADPDGRWLGALATSAKRHGLSLDAAVSEWARITGLDPNDEGCHCCGAPHYFS